MAKIEEKDKTAPGANLEAAYAAWRKAEENGAAQRSKADAAEIDRRRTLISACLELHAAHAAADHGGILKVYERAGICESTARSHLALANVYLLAKEHSPKELASVEAEGKYLSVNQGEALKEVYDWLLDTGLEENLPDFAVKGIVQAAEKQTDPSDIRKLLKKKQAELDPPEDPDLGGEPTVRIVEERIECGRFAVVGGSYKEIKAALVHLLNDRKTVEKFCREGLGLVAAAPDEPKAATKGIASACSSKKRDGQALNDIKALATAPIGDQMKAGV